jgi:hypothetical protein
VGVKPRQLKPKPAQANKDWQKTQYANLIRYVPSGKYYARLRVNGKLIVKSLKTQAISVAKLKLSDLDKHERKIAEQGRPWGSRPGCSCSGGAAQLARRMPANWRAHCADNGARGSASSERDSEAAAREHKTLLCLIHRAAEGRRRLR